MYRCNTSICNINFVVEQQKILALQREEEAERTAAMQTQLAKDQEKIHKKKPCQTGKEDAESCESKSETLRGVDPAPTGRTRKVPLGRILKESEALKAKIEDLKRDQQRHVKHPPIPPFEFPNAPPFLPPWYRPPCVLPSTRPSVRPPSLIHSFIRQSVRQDCLSPSIPLSPSIQESIKSVIRTIRPSFCSSPPTYPSIQPSSFPSTLPPTLPSLLPSVNTSSHESSAIPPILPWKQKYAFWIILFSQVFYSQNNVFLHNFSEVSIQITKQFC